MRRHCRRQKTAGPLDRSHVTCHNGSRPRSNSRENQAVDLRGPVALYEAGHTIAEVAARLHVAPRTVVRNFDKAGIPRRGPGPPPRDVPVAEIQRLRDEGLTMPEVAAAVGTTVNIARKRYRRTQLTGRSMRPTGVRTVGRQVLV